MWVGNRVYPRKTCDGGLMHLMNLFMKDVSFDIHLELLSLVVYNILRVELSKLHYVIPQEDLHNIDVKC